MQRGSSRSSTFAALLALVALAGAAIGWLGSSRVGSAQVACARSCAPGVPRDPRGCCQMPATRGARRAAPRACLAGQIRDADTRGHCCWPGQGFSASRDACIGQPQCPDGMVLAEGESCECASGTEIGVDTDGHCCWPGQVWMPESSACGGRPTHCPEGFTTSVASCDAPIPRCPEGMVGIPGGTFWMGSDDPAHPADMRPRHQVTLSPFCFDGAGREDRAITWTDAARACAQAGVRLPTEAEWERVARGPDGQAVHGRQWGVQGLFTYQRQQWVSDWHGPYSLEPATDPQGPPAGGNRVLRGMWDQVPASFLARRRASAPPGTGVAAQVRCAAAPL